MPCEQSARLCARACVCEGLPLHMGTQYGRVHCARGVVRLGMPVRVGRAGGGGGRAGGERERELGRRWSDNASARVCPPIPGRPISCAVAVAAAAVVVLTVTASPTTVCAHTRAKNRRVLSILERAKPGRLLHSVDPNTPTLSPSPFHLRAHAGRTRDQFTQCSFSAQRQENARSIA